MTYDYDVVIVGAGLAGALIAWKLAGSGAKVLIIEAGRRNPDRLELVSNYVRAGLKTPHSPYVDAENDLKAPSPDSATDYYVQDTSGIHPENRQFKSTYERRTGGSTWHWLGHTPRLLPNDFRMRSVYGVGVDWPISYEEIEPWYCSAEAAMGIAGDDGEWDGLFGAHRSQPFPMSKIWPSYSDLKVTEALDGKEFEGTAFRIFSTPSARNSTLYDGRPPCAGNSICVPLCPIGAKYDASVHVNKAVAAGATLWERSIVTRLTPDTDGSIHSVSVVTWGGQQITVSGAVVVVAAHAIETPRLLLMSNVANTSGQVGLNLMDHLQRAGLGLANEPLFPFRGPPSVSGIDVFRDGEARRDHSAFRISLGNDGWSRKNAPYAEIVEMVSKDKLFGLPLQKALVDRLTRQLRLSTSTEVLPSSDNRVELSDVKDAMGLPRPRLIFAPDAYTLAGLAKADAAMSAVFTAMGSTNVGLATDPHSYSGAGHIMGTCRMGDDPQTSVVDRECRSHDHQSLFIVGASAFPTVGTANPSLTVAAIALRAAETITSQLGGILHA